MKKVITMAIAAIALTALFAGCGKPCNYSGLVGTYEGTQYNGGPKFTVVVEKGFMTVSKDGKELFKDVIKGAGTVGSVMSSEHTALLIKQKDGTFKFNYTGSTGPAMMKKIK